MALRGTVFAGRDIHIGHRLPLAVRLGLATLASYDRWCNAFARHTAQYPDSALLWPLLIGPWKRKPAVQAAL